MEQCKDCDLRDFDTIACAKSELQNSINELKRKIPILRIAAKDFECPYYQRMEIKCKE
uniref:Uncharacterized protein n=1 Tax=Myoviridae sp. ct5xZ3 TaxID=2827601 RepID=A0A8S5RRJ4_9CAUD|nr:MAG TPA: hypothetical protein [Myoviridae sp. ct5xZ3]